MPCLIPEILFTVCKKLIKDGCHDCVLGFGLSGKQPLKSLNNKVASITNVELYDNCYSGGWVSNRYC
uniref:Uncharacterized protein n=1 Tax=Panagrolaimus davidi TaxID=227884 RepID=A0A914PP99_9BILA